MCVCVCVCVCGCVCVCVCVTIAVKNGVCVCVCLCVCVCVTIAVKNGVTKTAALKNGATGDTDTAIGNWRGIGHWRGIGGPLKIPTQERPLAGIGDTGHWRYGHSNRRLITVHSSGQEWRNEDTVRRCGKRMQLKLAASRPTEAARLRPDRAETKRRCRHRKRFESDTARSWQ